MVNKLSIFFFVCRRNIGIYRLCAYIILSVLTLLSDFCECEIKLKVFSALCLGFCMHRRKSIGNGMFCREFGVFSVKVGVAGGVFTAGMFDDFSHALVHEGYSREVVCCSVSDH